MSAAFVLSGQNRQGRLPSIGRRILLLAPPVNDFRLEWSQWHQPMGLLRFVNWFQSHGKDVRLLDCLNTVKGQRIPRQSLGIHEVEGYKIHKWHFGLPYDDIEKEVQKLLSEKWKPDTVFVTSLNSIWWESVRDTIHLLKRLLPKAKIILGGAYPSLEPEHAAEHSGADRIVVGSIPEVAQLPADLSLYAETPYSTGIYFYSPKAYRTPRHRAILNIVKEIKQKALLGVREFVFFDEEIQVKDREPFGKLLDQIADLGLDIHFILPGNVSPKLITQRLATKMRRARVVRVYLRCDMRFGEDEISYTTELSEYERCTKALVNHGGFKAREGTVAAMLVVGFPYEDLNRASERLIRLANIVGSVVLVPFQYVPALHKGPLFERALSQHDAPPSPEAYNSKLFPLARLSGKKLDDYFELTRLASLLNSKYQSKTFDFLGESLTARMFRDSIRTEGWNPFRTTDQPSDGEAVEFVLTPVEKAIYAYP